MRFGNSMVSKWIVLVNKYLNMTKFLDDLKNALDNGEFNSKAAEKINVLVQMADSKTDLNELKENYEERYKLDSSKIEDISEFEMVEKKTEYEIKMKELKEIDMINSEIALLMDIEYMVQQTIDDMLNHINEIKTKYSENLEANTKYTQLANEIKRIEDKYKN